jgi:hypothetical protein
MHPWQIEKLQNPICINLYHYITIPILFLSLESDKSLHDSISITRGELATLLTNEFITVPLPFRNKNVEDKPSLTVA